MKNATMINQDYQGPTRNPHGETLARLTHQFRNVRGPEQLDKALKAWGICEVSPKQARFWNLALNQRERETFCDLAGLSVSYSHQQWQQIPAKQRARLWQAVSDAATWGERLRGRW